MPVFTQHENLKTRGYCDVHDITPLAEALLLKSGFADGIGSIFVPGSTAAITTIELESGAIQDLKNAIQRMVPEDLTYEHDKRWRDGNGFSHVRAALMKPGLAVSFQQGRFLLGTWQQLVLIDFDNRSRTREIIFQFVGE